MKRSDKTSFEIRCLDDNDRAWVRIYLREEWGSEIIVTRGKVHSADLLPGFIAESDGKPAGLITYRIDRNECEIISLNSIIEKQGVGSALIETVIGAAKFAECDRIWLVTTNDNLSAIGFYQKRGFHLKTIYPNALKKSRRLKPQIPLIGINGIPLRDEIELEIML
jgi:GNAT superfamily N-acetyltransferase